MEDPIDKNVLLATAMGIGITALHSVDVARMTDPAFSLSLSGEELAKRFGQQPNELETSSAGSFSQTDSSLEEETDDWEVTSALGGRFSRGFRNQPNQKPGRHRTKAATRFVDAGEDSASLSLPASFNDYDVASLSDDLEISLDLGSEANARGNILFKCSETVSLSLSPSFLSAPK